MRYLQWRSESQSSNANERALITLRGEVREKEKYYGEMSFINCNNYFNIRKRTTYVC
jgi:hypothetical protein